MALEPKDQSRKICPLNERSWTHHCHIDDRGTRELREEVLQHGYSVVCDSPLCQRVGQVKGKRLRKELRYLAKEDGSIAEVRSDGRLARDFADLIACPLVTHESEVVGI